MLMQTGTAHEQQANKLEQMKHITFHFNHAPLAPVDDVVRELQVTAAFIRVPGTPSHNTFNSTLQHMPNIGYSQSPAAVVETDDVVTHVVGDETVGLMTKAAQTSTYITTIIPNPNPADSTHV